MQIIRRNVPDLSSDISNQLIFVVEKSLSAITTQNDQFIINDTLWYAKSRKGDITPCVVNSASFISKAFQNNLATHKGWRGETKIDNQNFDGFGELISTEIGYKLDEKRIIPFLNEYLLITNTPDYLISKYFSIFYGMYIKREIFTLERIPKELHHYFIKTQSSIKLRVGVEFETGNIGSSFRAILKLNNLFLKQHIDIGVFITSNDKNNCATRIWPVSNRNGSFVELENRNYLDNVNLPLVEFGFSPDSFSSKALYLGENGELFAPKRTDRKITFKGRVYSVYLGANDEEILKLITI